MAFEHYRILKLACTARLFYVIQVDSSDKKDTKPLSDTKEGTKMGYFVANFMPHPLFLHQLPSKELMCAH